MKTRFVIALSMVVGAAMGATAFHGLHAQTNAPAYYVSEAEVIDQEAFREYGPKVPASVKAAGGKFLVRGGQIIAVEGEAPKRATLIVFESLEKAEAYRTSRNELEPLRRKAIKQRSFILEGIAAN